MMAALLAGCAGGTAGVSVAGGDFYDGYYDGFYGPFNDGYWGNDGFFWYSDGNHAWHRDDAHHFAHAMGRSGTWNHVRGTGVYREH